MRHKGSRGEIAGGAHLHFVHASAAVARAVEAGGRGAAGAAEVRAAVAVARAVVTSVAGVAEEPAQAQAQAMLRPVRRRRLPVKSKSGALTMLSIYDDIALSHVGGLIFQ